MICSVYVKDLINQFFEKIDLLDILQVPLKSLTCYSNFQGLMISEILCFAGYMTLFAIVIHWFSYSGVKIDQSTEPACVSNDRWRRTRSKSLN
jgi:hypothetical protein